MLDKGSHLTTTEEIPKRNDTDELDDLDLDSKEKKNEVQPETILIDTEKLQKKVFSTLTFQDINSDLVPVEKDFYSDVSQFMKLLDKRNIWIKIDSFINFRAERILAHCISFSPTVYERLSSEEQGLYKTVCKEVEKFREAMKNLNLSH